MSRYLLVPADGIGESKSIIIPPELVVTDLFTELQVGVKDKNRLRWLITEFSRCGISETENGLVRFKDRDLKINFRSFLTDSSNFKYFKKYEKLYEILRTFNVRL